MKCLSAALALTTAAAVLGGCGYSFERPHRQDVDSVAVEMFARGGQVFRREIEFRATEAVKKRIQHATDYTLTDKGRADTLLTGTIDLVSQSNLTTDPDRGRPRESEVTLNVSFRWIDRRTGTTLAERTNMLVSGTYARIDPLNETFEQARDQAVDELARRVVETMERPFHASDEEALNGPPAPVDQ